MPRATRIVWLVVLAAGLLAVGPLVAVGAFVAVGPGESEGAAASGTVAGPWDWPTYGHDAQHTFHGRSTLTRVSVGTLKQAWQFPAGDAVTATPTVVAGTVFVGSWDRWFYALALADGSLRWKFRLDAQPAITPQPGQVPRDVTSVGGIVTSSAWFQRGDGHRPDLVIFGAGYTLYALEARSGRLFWKHAYTGRPDRPPDPAHDETRIFSSPVVVDDKVIIGVSTDGQGRRGYVVAANLRTGKRIWTRETDVDAHGRIVNDGCGSVWSSGTVLAEPGLVVFDVSDCHFANVPPLAETVVALHVRDGHVAWRYRPERPDRGCDFDFGATVNAGVAADGTPTFLGVGGKDGTYYSLDPRTGRLRWRTNVVFGGPAGGFIATGAYDGHHVYGSTALGDYGRFEESGKTVQCAPGNPRDQAFQEPTVHAFDARSGKVLWQAEDAPSFGATTVAGGLTFNGLALRDEVQVRDAVTGELLTELPLAAPCWSGIATVGNAVIFGTGASQQDNPDGVVAFTPDGKAPTVPSR